MFLTREDKVKLVQIALCKTKIRVLLFWFYKTKIINMLCPECVGSAAMLATLFLNLDL